MAIILKNLTTRMGIMIVSVIVISTLSFDFAVIVISKRDMIQSEIDKGLIVIDAVESQLMTQEKNPFDFIDNSWNQTLIETLIDRTNVNCLYLYYGERGRWLAQCGDESLESAIMREAMISFRLKKKIKKFGGAFISLLWGQKENVIVSCPIFEGGSIEGSVAISINLKGVYDKLGNRNVLFLIYGLINIIILSLIALYRFRLIVIKPIRKLLKRAEEYKDDSEIFILLGDESDEYGKLSRSLNSMLHRISDDRKRLQDTVNSLEIANKELKKAQKEIVRAEKLASIGRLSSGIAHEIGNPAGIVLGYLDLVREEGFSEQEKIDFIERAEKEILRIKKIIQQLLQLSKPSENIAKAISVHDVLDEIISVFQYQPIMEKMKVVRRYNAAQDNVYADFGQLSQVFLHILINAADALSFSGKEENGQVTIETGIVSQRNSNEMSFWKGVEIKIMDNGPGIEKDELEKIFDPFYTTKEPGEGTGLGLSVCFTIVESMGGKILADSEKNIGTTMTIILPIVNIYDGLDV